MNFEAAMEHALARRGSSIHRSPLSLGATNVKSQPLKTGGQLAAYLAKEADVSEETRLEDAAEAFIDLYGEDRLIELLREKLYCTDC